MNKPNKAELEYFIRYSLDSDKYKRYMELYEEIERLQQRIDKAIEYINDIAPWEEKTEEGDIIKGKLIQDDYVDILLDILKGVDKR